MKNMLKRFKNERGLTLVELLAVIVILAIISTIAFVMIGKVIENSKVDAHIANAQQLIASAKLYDSQGGEFGKGDDSENTVSSGTLQSEGLIDELINPWDADADYSGSVTKNTNNDGDGVTYTVSMEGSYDISCTITGKNEKELAGGKETACD